MGDSNPEPDTQQQQQQQHSPPPSDSVQPQMTMHPISSYSSMPMHMYPFPPGISPAQPTRTKRRQVKNACTNCQKACKKCDDARPCLRCVKYGIAEDCVDSQRKERQKGIKRGPYKKRDGKTANVDRQQVDVAVQQQGMVIPPAVAATAVPSPTPPMSYVAPVSYPPGIYPQYPAPTAAKPGETPPMYYPPPFYYTPIPAPPPHVTGQDGEPVPYVPHPQYYPALFYGPPQAYATGPYMVPHPPRPDAPVPMAPTHYAPYPQTYSKPPSRGPGADGVPPMIDPRRDGRVEHVRIEAMASAQAKAG